MDAALREAKGLVEDAALHEQQLDLLEPITPEEMAEAQEALGPMAGRVAVLCEARVRRKGRPKGVRNRRTDDLVAYLSQFGPDPAVALMQIIGTEPEMLVERSAAMDTAKRRMSYGDAQAMRIRAAEAVLPYFHGKQPVRVDATIRGVIVQEQIGGGGSGGGSEGGFGGAGGFMSENADPLGVLDAEWREAE